MQQSKRNVNRSVLFGLIIIHATALLCFFFFSWSGVIAALILIPITAMGITVGYHRMLTHSSFKTYAPIKWALTLAGMTAVQGSPIDWVTTHRMHHLHSDKEGDPHSPRHGKWHSHIAWLWKQPDRFEMQRLYRKFSKDLLEQRFMRFFSRWYTYLGWQAFVIVVLLTIGFLIGGWHTALSMVVFGFLARLVWVYHFTWAVNSATHLWGYKNFEVDDDSRNLWWVALATYGEGWHNNHHAHQRSANHGMRWWEFDPSFWLIRFLAAIGCAWHVCSYSYAQHELIILYKRE